MTSTPVNNVSALMNFVGGKNLTQTGGTNQANSFGDLMSMTRNGSNTLSSQKQMQTVEPVSKDTVSRDVDRSRAGAVKATENTGKPVDNVDTVSVEETVNEAGKELVKDIAEELGVSEEEVIKAMEELGLSIYQLFEPANLTQLVLTISGEQDAAALLTDEGLFAKLQDILKLAGDTMGQLAEELNVRPEEMRQILDQLQNASENGAVSDVQDEAQENAPKITIEVKVNGETVKLSADENGNVDKTIGTVSQQTEETASKPDQKQEGGESRGKSDGNEHTGNALIDTMVQGNAQVQDAEAPQQVQGFFSSQTQEIMDQIMDYMKIQLKPGVDQLEMQLHPASLGNVHIQITSKGGEVTAQFQVQNETVKAAIESQIVELKESLKDQGVKVEAVQVTVENHGFESNLWQGQGREQNGTSQGGKKTPRRINLNDLDALFEEEATEEELLSARVMEMNGNTVDYTA